MTGAKLTPHTGIALTTRQVARGELETNLANIFLNKFAKKYFFWRIHLVEINCNMSTKISVSTPVDHNKKQAIFSNNILAN